MHLSFPHPLLEGSRQAESIGVYGWEDRKQIKYRTGLATEGPRSMAVTKVVCVRDGVLFGARDRVRRLSRGRSSHGSISPQRPAGQILASCIAFRRHDKTSQRGGSASPAISAKKVPLCSYYLRVDMFYLRISRGAFVE